MHCSEQKMIDPALRNAAYRVREVYPMGTDWAASVVQRQGSSSSSLRKVYRVDKSCIIDASLTVSVVDMRLRGRANKAKMWSFRWSLCCCTSLS